MYIQGIPTRVHEGPRGMWMQGSTYSQPRRQEEVGKLALSLTVFDPRYSFYRRLCRPQGQFGHKVVKKSSPLRHPGSNTGRPSCSEAHFRLKLTGPYIQSAAQSIFLSLAATSRIRLPPGIRTTVCSLHSSRI